MLSSCKESNHFILYWDDKFHSTIEAGHKHGAKIGVDLKSGINCESVAKG